MKDFGLLVSAFACVLLGCTKAETERQQAQKIQEARGPASPLATNLAAGVSSAAGAAAPVVTHVVAPAATPTASTVVDVSKQTMSVDKFERLVLGLEPCRLERYQIDSNCAGNKALTAEINASTAWSDRAVVNAKIGARLVTHRAPAIRVKAAEFLAGTPEGFDAIADAAAHEKDVGVLQAFIRTAATHGSNPKVAEMLLAGARHTDKDVRMQAILAIAAPQNRGMTGGAEALVAIVETDKVPELRQAACEYGGRLGDGALVPMYEKMTASADDKELYGACMEGLVSMFHSHPSFDTANEAAYRLFLRRIQATPRTEQSPPWNVMSTFCYFSHESDLEKLAAWKKQTAPWFDAKEMRKAFASVVGDKHASWMARTASIESLVGLGATKAELRALETGLDASNASDKQVLDKLVSVLSGGAKPVAP